MPKPHPPLPNPLDTIQNQCRVCGDDTDGLIDGTTIHVDAKMRTFVLCTDCQCDDPACDHVRIS